MAGTSTENGGWDLLLGAGGASTIVDRLLLGRPLRIGLCMDYITRNVDPELTKAVCTAAATLAKATGGELVKFESPWTEAELEEVWPTHLWLLDCVCAFTFSSALTDAMTWRPVPQLLEFDLRARGRSCASRSWCMARTSPRVRQLVPRVARARRKRQQPAGCPGPHCLRPLHRPAQRTFCFCKGKSGRLCLPCYAIAAGHRCGPGFQQCHLVLQDKLYAVHYLLSYCN